MTDHRPDDRSFCTYKVLAQTSVDVKQLGREQQAILEAHLC
jgi:hypothetical protein